MELGGVKTIDYWELIACKMTTVSRLMKLIVQDNLMDVGKMRIYDVLVRH